MHQGEKSEAKKVTSTRPTLRVRYRLLDEQAIGVLKAKEVVCSPMILMGAGIISAHRASKFCAGMTKDAADFQSKEEACVPHHSPCVSGGDNVIFSTLLGLKAIFWKEH